MTKYVWSPNYGTNTISKVDPVGNTVLATYTLENNSTGVCFDGVNYWIPNRSGHVKKINVNGTVLATINISDAWGIVFANGFVWVANYTDGTVAKIDIYSNTIVATITVGTNPYRLCYDGLYLWVSNYGDGTISKIDVNSNTAISAVTVSTNPRGIAYDGSRLWVVNYGSHNVMKIDPVTGTILATVNVNTNPTEICFDGTAIWVGNYTDNNVSKINITTNTVIATVTVGSGPYGMCFDGNYVWCSNYNSGTLSKIDPVGNTVVATVTVGTNPMGGGAFALSPYRVKRTYGTVWRKNMHPSDMDGRFIRRKGHPASWVPFYQVFEQGYRVEDTSLAVYELYAGINVQPDFTKPPAATSATLPFSWTPTLPGGNGTVNIVVRQKNRFGFESFNVYSQAFVYQSGSQVKPPLSAPYNIRVYDALTGQVRVVAKYLSSNDALYPADTWEIYVKIGSDPVPGTDTPNYSGAMAFVGVEAGVQQTLGTWSAGSIAHVIVSVVRSSDGARTSSPVTLWTLALPISLPDGFMFGGTVVEEM